MRYDLPAQDRDDENATTDDRYTTAGVSGWNGTTSTGGCMRMVLPVVLARMMVMAMVMVMI